MACKLPTRNLASTTAPKPKVLVIADSRGAGLQSRFNQYTDKPYSVQVLTWKGRGIAAAVKDSDQTLNWLVPDIVLILAGICNITSLDHRTRQVSLSFTDEDKMLDEYTGKMDAIQHHFKVGKTPRLMFAQLVGMDLATYNNAPAPNPQQDLLDRTILSVNSSIASFNKNNGMNTPWTASEIHHHRKNGRKITQYQRLAEDGLHLTEELRDKWVFAIDKAIVKSIH